jgi:hypothetical protein
MAPVFDKPLWRRSPQLEADERSAPGGRVERPRLGAWEGVKEQLR